MDGEILIIRELTALLSIGENSAYTMAQMDGLPEFKPHDQRWFQQDDIYAPLSSGDRGGYAG